MKSVADGQVAATTTTVYTGVDSTAAVNISFLNTSASLTETITVTLTRSGSSARRVAYFVLAPNEQGFIQGLGLSSGDIIKAATSDATTVDYVVYETATDLPFTNFSLDATGSLKGLSPTTLANMTVSTKLVATLLELGPKPTDTYAATMTIDVTKSLHVISAANGTSATSTLTPSAAGTAGDILTILTVADSSGTVTVTFASTFHPSGTQATTLSHFSSIMFQSDGTRWIELCRTTNAA